MKEDITRANDSRRTKYFREFIDENKLVTNYQNLPMPTQMALNLLKLIISYMISNYQIG